MAVCRRAAKAAAAKLLQFEHALRETKLKLEAAAAKVVHGGQMVQGTPRSDAISILGRSRWIDVPDTSVAKWSAAEVRAVVDLLMRLFDHGAADVFVISPFRNVANRLKELIPAQLASRVRVGEDWWEERIGTIHTFQGKQGLGCIPGAGRF